MIRLPLDAYATLSPRERRPDIVVDLDDSGNVSLVFELEPRELVGTYQLVEDHVEPRGFPAVPDDPKEARIVELETRLEALKAVIAHRDLLRSRLEALALAPSIDRELSPGDARALAAILEHYAREAER
jgi:hypothetical protein